MALKTFWKASAYCLLLLGQFKLALECQYNLTDKRLGRANEQSDADVYHLSNPTTSGRVQHWHTERSYRMGNNEKTHKCRHQEEVGDELELETEQLEGGASSEWLQSLK